MVVSRPNIDRLLQEARLDPQVVSLEKGPPGGNNAISFLCAPDARYVLKVYARDADGTSSRLDREWRFLTVAAQAGLEGVPRPMARCDADAMAVYTFLPGRRPLPGDVSAADIDASAAFFAALNTWDFQQLGVELPNAAEACFSLNEHVALLTGRLARLPSSAGNEGADEFITHLQGMADVVVPAVEEAWRDLGFSDDVALSSQDRCLSPSDFGFHNVLRDHVGGLSFVDFEYAGWDDPAKSICDVFLQPAVPLDRTYFDRFARIALAWMPDVDRMVRRCRAAFPLFALKWCCIVLNPFDPEWVERNRGDARRENIEELRKVRLDRAVAMSRTLFLD